jgi:hypothetical protein
MTRHSFADIRSAPALIALAVALSVASRPASARECDWLSALPEGAEVVAEQLGDIRFRVLLPAGYDETRQVGYSVSYVLDDASGGPEPCRETADLIRSATVNDEGLVLVVVDGSAGMASDWRSGAPLWQSLHVRTLFPYVEAKYRIVDGAREYRSASGVSCGGLIAIVGRTRDDASVGSRFVRNR